MLNKILENPTLFYTLFTVFCVLIILIFVFIINTIKKKLQRKKLKKTSDVILNEHYEEVDENSLDDEIKKIEEKANKVKTLVDYKSDASDFIIGKPIQIEINSELDDNIENTKQPDYIDQILTKMQEDLKKKEEKQIYEFEKDQEENAIISYQELLKANAKDDQKQPENITSILNNDTTINNSSLININALEDLKVVNLDDLINIKEEKQNKEEIKNIFEKNDNKNINVEISNIDKNFKTSEFISPVYGRIEPKLDYPTIPSMDKLKSKPISEMKDDEFLSLLKAFRKNL